MPREITNPLCSLQGHAREEFPPEHIHVKLVDAINGTRKPRVMVSLHTSNAVDRAPVELTRSVRPRSRTGPRYRVGPGEDPETYMHRETGGTGSRPDPA